MTRPRTRKAIAEFKAETEAESETMVGKLIALVASAQRRDGRFVLGKRGGVSAVVCADGKRRTVEQMTKGAQER